MSGRKNSREAILDAAETLIRESGVNSMTLDAVATHAGLSKGGLLYRFPSKDDLLRGLIERHVKRFDGPAKGRPAENYVSQRLAMLDEQRGDRQVGQGMLAAIAEKPELLDPIRAVYRRIWEAMRAEEPDLDKALLAWLAAEGLGSFDMFNTSPLSDEEHERASAAIRKLVAG